ncbi:hypothetical protein N3K63_00515 [Microbacterium sp. W1N]|uniref:DUF6541 family protein n=1 Tax=Microbacterium festucae TaxID=2977531 RepID=UPI0021BEBFFB|nr:DUF6541 family protein [Microbacterium festucae]MCT9818758.1 hypothetical protein [Microbacterium festucae]
MIQEWYVALLPLLIATLAFVVPGLAVIIAGWGTSRISLLFLAPAVSTALLAVSATIAPVVGMAWSALPLVILTAVAAVAAYGLRRWAGRDAPPRRLGWPRIIAPVAAFLVAAAIIGAQLAWAFGRPDNISQTFDAIVHVNTAAFAVDTTNASAFHIGATSDIPFYPNAWHSLVSLAALMTGVSTPVAVSAANIAIGAIAWPASCIALAGALFRGRTAALVSAAALSTGFGAFPMLLLFFGVLYPNLAAYAVLPAGIAVVVWLLRSTSAREATLWSTLLAVIGVGIGLAHPNAFLALFAFGASLAILEFAARMLRDRTRRSVVIHASLIVVLLVVGAGLWRFGRTNYDMSRWGPWQSTAQAMGEALLLSPRAYPITVTVSILTLLGLVAIIRRPRLYPLVVPYAIASFMFVLVSGTGVNNLLREMVTNPWYNDSFRLAALLPVAGIPVATLGALTVVDLSRRALARWNSPKGVAVVATVIGVAVLFSVGVGPNVLRVAADTRSAYAMTSTSPLLTSEEQTLLERLDRTTAADALIAGSPWTGASLAYAIGNRQVVEKHVFGTRDDDEIYLDENLRNIDTDPRVCAAINEIGVDYVLDFGTQNVWNNPAASADRDGIQGLPPTESLALVDSEGPAAKLYRVVGCTQ